MDVSAQVAAARRSVLALPEPDRATLVVSGSDGVSWLNGLVTCDLVKRAETGAAYGLFVARSGRIIADALIAVDGERVLVSVPRAALDPLRAHLDHYLVMEDAEVAPRTDALSAVSFHGPGSGDVLVAARAAGAAGGHLDRTGLGGAVVFIPEERSAETRATILAAAHDRGGMTGDPAGWNALRLECAVPQFGSDFGDTTYPQEANLEKIAVSFDKGCYLGQEVVCMLEMRGHVKRRLVAVVLDGSEPPSRGAVVSDEAGAVAGEVTSAAASPTLGHPLALAMLKRAYTEPGRRVVIAGVPGHVVERPS
jgi:folate-binding protein YgfZ